jgi:hypothetical protein
MIAVTVAQGGAGALTVQGPGDLAVVVVDGEPLDQSDRVLVGADRRLRSGQRYGELGDRAAFTVARRSWWLASMVTPSTAARAPRRSVPAVVAARAPRVRLRPSQARRARVPRRAQGRGRRAGARLDLAIAPLRSASYSARSTCSRHCFSRRGRSRAPRPRALRPSRQVRGGEAVGQAAHRLRGTAAGGAAHDLA